VIVTVLSAPAFKSDVWSSAHDVAISINADMATVENNTFFIEKL